MPTDVVIFPHPSIQRWYVEPYVDGVWTCSLCYGLDRRTLQMLLCLLWGKIWKVWRIRQMENIC